MTEYADPVEGSCKKASRHAGVVEGLEQELPPGTGRLLRASRMTVMNFASLKTKPSSSSWRARRRGPSGGALLSFVCVREFGTRHVNGEVKI